MKSNDYIRVAEKANNNFVIDGIVDGTYHCWHTQATDADDAFNKFLEFCKTDTDEVVKMRHLNSIKQFNERNSRHF